MVISNLCPIYYVKWGFFTSSRMPFYLIFAASFPFVHFLHHDSNPWSRYSRLARRRVECSSVNPLFMGLMVDLDGIDGKPTFLLSAHRMARSKNGFIHTLEFSNFWSIREWGMEVCTKAISQFILRCGDCDCDPADAIKANFWSQPWCQDLEYF